MTSKEKKEKERYTSLLNPEEVRVKKITMEVMYSSKNMFYSLYFYISVFNNF